MPKLLGLEPEQVSKAKPLLLIGGGAILLFFILKGRGAPQVAADAPSNGQPMAGVPSPAAQGELSQTGTVVDALQQQMQQHQMDFDVAAANLALQQQSQQMRFDQLSQEYSLQRQKQLDAQQDAFTHEEFKQLKKQGKSNWFSDNILKPLGQGIGLYAEYQGIPTKRPTQVANPIHPFYPTPNGRLPGQ